jgi:hypothetical protein
MVSRAPCPPPAEPHHVRPTRARLSPCTGNRRLLPFLALPPITSSMETDAIIGALMVIEAAGHLSLGVLSSPLSLPIKTDVELSLSLPELSLSLTPRAHSLLRSPSAVRGPRRSRASPSWPRIARLGRTCPLPDRDHRAPCSLRAPLCTSSSPR